MRQGGVLDLSDVIMNPAYQSEIADALQAIGIRAKLLVA
jgi:hypothetical protein